MSNLIKILLCSLPYIFSALIAYSLIYPAILEEQTKTAEVKRHKQDLDAVDQKLKARAKADAEKTSLEAAIRSLREAVPKAPEVELLLVDLERMCVESGVDLVAIESPDPEAVKAMAGDESPSTSSGQPVKAAAKIAARTNSKDKNASPPPDPNPLRQLNKQIYVTGSYGQIVNFMKKLEIYKRVVGINQLAISLPQDVSEGGMRDPATERAKRLSLRQPMLSFILTLYYLP